MIDETTNDTVGAGGILDARKSERSAHPDSDIRWHPSALDRKHRWRATGQPGATIWFTGLPASGKSTLRGGRSRPLRWSNRGGWPTCSTATIHLAGLSETTWASLPATRTENVRQVGQLTKLLFDAAVVALASLVSPLELGPRDPRAPSTTRPKLPFIEVHVATSLAECEKRDPKGLYARTPRRELKGLTGVDAPYEPPESPDLVLDTTGADIDDLAAQVIALLDERSPRQHQ